jgi:hypothetical protein
VSGELAHIIGFERGEVAVDGGPTQPMTIRVTHVYRCIEGVWRLVHRHADFPRMENDKACGRNRRRRAENSRLDTILGSHTTGGVISLLARSVPSARR